MKDFTAEAHELFDWPTVAEVAKILRVSDATAIASLRTDLIELCGEYRATIARLPCDLPDAPFNVSLTKRADWLETKVINPIETILEALRDENCAMFSAWPYPLGIPEFADHTRLRRDLHNLRASTIALRPTPWCG